MISILLVDDEPEKRRLISQVLLRCAGVSQESITVATDVIDAKRALSSRGFDLLLLDINLPKRAGQHPVVDGGTEVLRWFRTRGKAHRPKYIIGTSAYPDSVKSAKSSFDNLVWSLVQFEYGSDSWAISLANSVDLIIDELVPPYASDGNTYKTDVLIVTALYDPELTSILNMPIGWVPIAVRHDSSSYKRASFPVAGGALELIATSATDKGLTGAAVAVTKGIYTFRPRYVVMTGICAGLEKRTSLGDIVIADLCWDWGSGKIKVENKVEIFHPAPYQQRLDETLRASAEELSESGVLTDGLIESLPPNKLKATPRVHIGPVASGASVLQSTAAMKRILRQHKDLLALEMEIFSVFFACQVAPLPRPKAFALKGVCDFGNEKKADGHQRIAAAASAHVLFKFLKNAISPSLDFTDRDEGF